MKKSILIANRGEIAMRILRSAKEKGFRTILAHSSADKDSLAARLADLCVCIGPGPAQESYLNPSKIILAAQMSGADAIHPGYGFLAEQEILAKMSEKAGLIFIGPIAEHLSLMGDKESAKKFAMSLNIPCIPGSERISYPRQKTNEDCLKIASSISYPLLIKATAGGGGKGMRIVHTPEDLLGMLELTQNEAHKAYGDGSVYFEKYLSHPRHIEVQILGDGHGKGVHFGLRECSIQRRYQKIIEESLPMHLSQEIQNHLYQDALRIIQALSYRGLGTIEFLYQDNKYYFIEMNTRVQVEHPISEMISGHDLVAAQISVAFEEPWKWEQEKIVFKGHAIECRINAESPKDYQPRAGKISKVHMPGGFGVRIESMIYPDIFISPFYDSLIAKIISYGETRELAIRKMQFALEEMQIEGLETNLELHRQIFQEELFLQGVYDTNYLKKHDFFSNTASDKMCATVEK